MMSANGRDVPGRYHAPGSRGAAGTEPDGRWVDERRHSDSEFASGRVATGFARRKRRRPRPQRGKPFGGGDARGAPADFASRERIFQELEGLLRQIREQAEESGSWPEDRLAEFTQAVTSFTKSIEEQSDPISQRAHSEYQRIRDKLSQALRG
jgi:hypothetical protein